MARRFHRSPVFIALALACAAVRAHDADLTTLDLETLMSMDVTVTSAAKRAQSTVDAAAAVFVLTREDIRRSAATSIPDLLRVVPGLQVARINTRSWAVTARGFNSQFANKLQVLVDGRSVYATIFSGVMWEEQFVPLDQIERIEVVRGPGGALWGINAVNGVINIITRRASEQKGLHVSGGAGSDISEAANVSYGASVGSADLLLYADHSKYDAYRGDTNDLDRSQVGVRLERSIATDHYTARFEYADEEFGTPSPTGEATLPPSAKVGNVGLDWRRNYDGGAQTEATAHYSWTDRGQPGGWDESNAGFDVQHTAARRGRHLATFGAGFRHVTDDQRDARAAEAFARASVEYQQWSVYAQDETYWFDDRVRVIAGAKLEDLKYTDLAFQPTLRVLWHVNDHHTLWSAASRAARTPSRFEMHSALTVQIPSAGLPTFLTITGSEQLDAERLDAYEFGWRWRPDPRFTFDVALFDHQYDRLIMQTPSAPQLTPGFPPQLVIPIHYANAASAGAQGAEIALEWLAAERLRFQAGANWLDMDLPEVSSSLNAFGAEPEYAWSLRVRYDFSPSTELDLTLRAVDAIATQDAPSYESLDVRLGWRPTPDIETSISIENALDDEHIEFADEVSRGPGMSIGRSAFARISWRLGRK